MTYGVTGAIVILLYLLKDTFHKRVQYHLSFLCIEMICFLLVVLYILVSYIFRDVIMTS